MRKCISKTSFISCLIILSAALYFAYPSTGHAAQAEGKKTYDRYCAACHGVNGDGDGLAYGSIYPPARDFTLGLFKWKSTPYDELSPSLDDLRRVIKGHSRPGILGSTGLAGTAMPGWSDILSSDEIDEVAAYVLSFSGLSASKKPPVALPKKPVPAPQGIANGERLFKDRCSECHGQRGRGDAAKKLKDDWGERTWPRDLTKPWTFRFGPGLEDIYTRISVGIPGTQMPSFADPSSKKFMTDDERMDVAGFVQMMEDAKRAPAGVDTISARYSDAGVPADPQDQRWESADYANLLIGPQLMHGDRLYSPTLDALSIKALYDESEVAFLVTWNDRTLSVAGDANAQKLVDGELYDDAASLQFPLTNDPALGLPHFDMGSSTEPVVIWKWASGMAEKNILSAEVIEADGPGHQTPKNGPIVRVASIYDYGTWKVVFKTGLKEARINGAGSVIPVSFSLWDGSNGDRGDKRTMTGWVDVYFSPSSDRYRRLAPIVSAAIVLAGGIIFIVAKKR